MKFRDKYQPIIDGRPGFSRGENGSYVSFIASTKSATPAPAFHSDTVGKSSLRIFKNIQKPETVSFNCPAASYFYFLLEKRAVGHKGVVFPIFSADINIFIFQVLKKIPVNSSANPFFLE